MKNILFIFVLCPVFLLAQSQNHNYTRVSQYKEAVTDINSSPNIYQADTEVIYFDGLGRPIQRISPQASSSGKSIVTHIEYDGFGRAAMEYLPYVREDASSQYAVSAKDDTFYFYNNPTEATTGNPHFEATHKPFSRKLFDNSPLSRVTKQGAPGVWDAVTGLYSYYDKAIEFAYEINTAQDAVKMFRAVHTCQDCHEQTTLQLDGFYQEGALVKDVIKNENHTTATGKDNTTEEYLDKLDRVILKRSFLNEQPLDTYYVYDQYDNLIYVIPPKADGTITAQVLDDLCYQYKYDYRKRLVEKKIPGKQWEFILYNKIDRPIASGPVLSPFGDNRTGWLITKYDVFGRVVYTGWMEAQGINSQQRATQQDVLNSTTAPLFEVKTQTANTINNVTISYTSQAFPISGFDVLTINYYDHYNFPDAVLTSEVMGQPVSDNTKSLLTGSWSRILEDSGIPQGELSTFVYDRKGRLIKTHKTNHAGGYTETEMKLRFNGQVALQSTHHTSFQSTEPVTVLDQFNYSPQGQLISQIQTINNDPQELIFHNQYDELGRLIVKNVGGPDVNTYVGLQKVDFKYNIRGWLKEINNVFDLNDSTGGFNDLFAFKINYDEVTRTDPDTQEILNTAFAYQNSVKQLYNGNIAETYWKTASDNVLRKYSYAYDNLSRITEAYYQKPLQVVEQTNSYNESMQYDKNGNITRIERTGNADSNTYTNQIDELDFFYGNNSNLLLKVSDLSNDPNGFKDDSDGTNDTEDDYKYDLNGNLTYDQNKAIDRITYNHLNLPTQIDFSNSSSIYYLYNADGVKLRKTVQYGAQPEAEIVVTDYIDGFQYENRVLLFFPHSEGYVKQTLDKNENASYDYVYNYTDHLGNIRLSYALDPETKVLKILEENHYYPFGLKHTNYNSGKKGIVFEELPEIKKVKPVAENGYKYKYQGQERQDELGLNWDSFKWRSFDYTIGRFISIDPLAEDFVYNSTYAFAENKIGLGKELEGAELLPHPWLLTDAVKNPNSVGAHVAGFGEGLGNVMSGIVNAVSNPVDTVKGIGNAVIWVAVGSQFSESVDNILGTNSTGAGDSILNGVFNGGNNLVNGDGFARGNVIGEITGTIIAGEAIGAGFSRASSTIKKSPSEAPVTNQIYSRPKNATTTAQRASVQGKPCVDCGGKSKTMVADHKVPLVKEHYTTGTINKTNMHSTKAVQPQCTTCSSKQGAEMSKYSKNMKKIINERTGN